MTQPRRLMKLSSKQIIRAMDEKGLSVDQIVECLYLYKGRIYTRLDVQDAIAIGPKGDLAKKMSEILGFVSHNPPLPRRSHIEIAEYKKLLHKLKTVDCQANDVVLSGEIDRKPSWHEPYKREPGIKPYKDKFIARIHQNHKRGGCMTFVDLCPTREEAEAARARYALKHGLDDR